MAVETEAWVPISREELEYVIVPWLGPKYQPWLREQVRQTPDPGVVLIRGPLHEVYSTRPMLTPFTREQKRRLGLK